MTKNIDQLLTKISGKAYIEQKLELEQDVQIVVYGAVVKEETLDNQDESVNIIYAAKPMTEKSDDSGQADP